MVMTRAQHLHTMPDGAALAIHTWSPGTTARGTVLIAHGLGEHAGRYAQLAGDLTAAGWRVVVPDLRGHGATIGPRGVVPSAEAIRDDLLALLAAERRGTTGPVILLGHSMGGAFAAWTIATTPTAADALVLSSPALQADLSAVQRLLVQVMRRAAPDVSNGLKVDAISHDLEVVRAYRIDPLVHDRVSARLADAIAQAGAASLAAAPRWTTPTLLLFAGSDALVNPAGSRAFAAAAPAAVLTSECYQPFYHELFNEVERAAPVARLMSWLEERLTTHQA
jgi:alpha-beta hydrolase superfamily lysophospholipase